MITISKKIELDAPCVGNVEKGYLQRAIDSGFVSSVGPFIGEFEQKIAAYAGAKGAVALQSGTSALFLSLYELGIGPGDEVIVPSLSFVATINPVIQLGATPVIVDVSLDTWNIDPGRIKQAITPKTKAIIVVHLYGNPCPMAEIVSIARDHDVRVIEDATESLGAKYQQRHTGAIGDMGCLSFNGNKLVTTGGGGMVIGNNLKQLAHIRSLANQAKDDSTPGLHGEMGFNFRMTNIEAALGLAQFEQMEAFLVKKRKFHSIYRQMLEGEPGLFFPQAVEGAQQSFWLSVCRFDAKQDMEKLVARLKARGVPTRRVFLPLNRMPYLVQYSAGDCSGASQLYEHGLCLPSSVVNHEDNITEAAHVIKEVLHG
jgi:perosamine synthetase